MKRPLKSSEKVLLALVRGSARARWPGSSRCATIGPAPLPRSRKSRALEPQLTAAVAAAADAPFWDERQAWLDATMPAMGDSGQAHSLFLQQLQTTARERGLVVASPVLLKPEGGPHHRDLAITLQITGPDQALYRWLADLQSPEKFQLVKYLLLTPQPPPPPSRTAPRMTGTVTVARLFKP